MVFPCISFPFDHGHPVPLKSLHPMHSPPSITSDSNCSHQEIPLSAFSIILGETAWPIPLHYSHMAAKIILPNIFHFIPAIKNYRGDSSGWNWLMEYMCLSPILPETPWKWQCRHLKIHNQQGQQKLGGKKEEGRDVHGGRGDPHWAVEEGATSELTEYWI